MTPKESADLVITCVALGSSGKPLWEYLPGMFVESAFHETDDRYLPPGRIVAVNVLRGSVYLSMCTVQGELVQTRAEWMRPDLADELTAQALYLLVRQAYLSARIVIDRRDYADRVQLTFGDTTHGYRHLLNLNAEGPAHAVFARALAKAPVRP